MPTLKPIKTQTKTISFRLPAELVADLEAVKADAKVKGLCLDLTDQIEKLVSSSIRQARAELIESSTLPNTKTEAAFANNV